MPTSRSSLLQQQIRCIGSVQHRQPEPGHCCWVSQAYTPLLYLHSELHCSYYLLCCSKGSDSMYEKVLIAVRMYLFLGHLCLICYPEALSQNGWGWQEPLGFLWSNHPVQARLPKADCWKLCLDSFWISQGWRLHASLGTLLQCSAFLRIKKHFSAYICAWHCSSPGAGLCISRDSQQLISPAVLYHYIWSKFL